MAKFTAWLLLLILGLFAVTAVVTSEETIEQIAEPAKGETGKYEETKEMDEAKDVADGKIKEVDTSEEAPRMASEKAGATTGTVEDSTKLPEDASGSYLEWAVEKSKNLAGTTQQVATDKYSEALDAASSLTSESQKRMGEAAEILYATKDEASMKAGDAPGLTKDYASKAGEHLSAAKDKVTNSFSGALSFPEDKTSEGKDKSNEAGQGAYDSVKDVVADKLEAARTATGETAERVKRNYEAAGSLGQKGEDSANLEPTHEEL